MSANTIFESPNPKRQFLTGVMEGAPSPAHGATDVEAATPQPAPSPGFRSMPRVKVFFLAILYTLVFAITTAVVCLCGSFSIGFPYDERSAVYTRVVCASVLGSAVLGPIYFTNRRFMAFMKGRSDVVHTHIANGRLLKGLGHLLLLLAITTGVVAVTATFGHGLVFWPLVYSESLTTKKMVVDAVLIPVACLLGGVRWTCEVVGMGMWVLVRIPKISTSLEGDKNDRLIKMSVVFTVLRWSIQGAASALPLCVLFITPGWMDKWVAHYDKYREPIVKAAEPQPEPPVLV